MARGATPQASFCYNAHVHLKVQGPKKPSRGTIGNDADYLRATCVGAEVRGQQVLLDRDVAALYGVETKEVNQAVKRNAERFYDGYILALTSEECSRSQIVTLNGKRGSNIKYLPHAFTEKGLYMLATVLRSSRAIQATHAIIETYAEVRAMKRELLALHTETDAKKRDSMMRHFGEALTDIVMPDLTTANSAGTDYIWREWSHFFCAEIPDHIL